MVGFIQNWKRVVLNIFKKEYFCENLSQTKALGCKIASVLKRGSVVAMKGDLGAGKTSLSQSICFALGVDEKVAVNSPTFTIVNQYDGRYPINHIDFYRLSSIDEFYLTGLDELLYGDSVSIIEWADKFSVLVPESALWVYLEFVDINSRKISIEWSGENCDENVFDI